METVLSINLITSNPRVRDGRPCIAGTGLRVTDVVVAAVFNHETPEQIATQFSISLGQVHAALAYYYEHKAELYQDIREQIATAKVLKEQSFGKANSGNSLIS